MSPPHSDYVVRAARPGDAEPLAALHCLPGFRHGTLRPPHVTPEAIRKRLEAAAGETHCLLAFAGEVLVGTIGLERFQGRRSHAGTIGMGVHDDWVGRGVGTRLLAEAVMIADRWMGLRRIELTVYTDNAPALALYRRFGFEIEGTHRGFALRDGALVDAHTMARLSPPMPMV